MTPAWPNGWSIRQATENDLEAIRSLYLDVWGYNRPRRYDHWRYVTPPDGRCPVMLAADGERLAGAYTIWPVKIRIGNEVVLGAQSMDTMTHPDCRGQGIFTKLALACFEAAQARGFQVLYGFPNPSSYPAFVGRLDFAHTGDIVHWVRPIKPSRHGKVPAAIGPLVDLASRLLPKGRKGNVEIAIARPPPAALNAVLDEWRQEKNVCRVERTAAWLDWRYGAETLNDYEWVCAYRDGSLVCCGVWGMQNKAWGQVADGRAHLTELLGSDEEGLGAVVATVIERARQADAMLLETICNLQPAVKLLRRAGFFAHRQAPFIVRSLTAGKLNTDIYTHANWRIMGGDVDTF